LFRHGRPQCRWWRRQALLAIDVPVFLDSRVAYARPPCSSRTGWRASSRRGIGADQAMTLFDGRQRRRPAGGPRLLLAMPPIRRCAPLRQQEALLETEDAAGAGLHGPEPGAGQRRRGGDRHAASRPQQLLQAVALISLVTMLAVLAAGFSLAWSVGGRIARRCANWSARRRRWPAASRLPPATTFAKPTWWRTRWCAGRRFAAPQPELKAWWSAPASLKNRSQLETLYATAPVGLSYVDAELRCYASTTTWPRSTSRKWWPTSATTSAT
jgi:hypothetical protein